MHSLAKKPNVLFLIAVRSHGALVTTKMGGRLQSLPYPMPVIIHPRLSPFMLTISLVISGFGKRFYKKYVKANIQYDNYKHIWYNRICEEFSTVWSINGKLHSFGGIPAVRTVKPPLPDLTTNIIQIAWRASKDMFHPHQIIVYDEWYKNGKLHRKHDYATILTVYNLDGTLEYCEKSEYIRGVNRVGNP